MLALMTRPSWRWTGMYLFIFSAIAMAVVVSTLLLADDASAQTDPPTDGNWTVLDNTVVRDRHIMLNGNLTVGPQGHLTLENVSLELNNTFPGRYYILVSSGGSMIVTDKDHDPTTKADASMVYSRRPNAHYSWRCSVDSVLRISASTVRHCGLLKGIVIETHDAMIDNSTISDGSYGVYVEDGSVQIYDSTIKDCWAGGIYIENGNAVVEGCIVMNNTFDGIMAIQNSDIIVRNSTVMDHFSFGISIALSTFTIEDCVVHGNGHTGVTIQTSNGTVVRTTVSNSTVWGINVRNDSNTTVVDCEVFDIEGIGIYFNHANGTVVGCHIHDCQNQGAHITDSGIRVLNSTLETSGHGLVIRDSPLYIVDNCTIRRNRDGGIAFSNHDFLETAGWVTRCRIYENDGVGIYPTGNTTCILRDPYLRDNDQYGIYCRLGGRVEWEVTNTSMVVNETLEYMGTILVTRGGELTIVNTTLEFNKDRFGDFGSITVTGGKMWILDQDPDKEGDHSEIYIDPSAPNNGTGFRFSVYNGGYLNGTRSLFTDIKVRVVDGVFEGRGCGFSDAPLSLHGDGEEVIIDLADCTFTDGEQGVFADGARVLISGCSFIRMGEAMNLWASDGSVIKDSTMFSTGVGIRLWRSSGLRVDNCTFTLSGDAIVTELSQNLIINNSKIDRSNGHGVIGRDSVVYVYGSVITQCSAGGAVLNDSILWIEDSTFSTNDRVGIRANRTWLLMTNSSVTGTDGIGVWNSYFPTGTMVWDFLMKECFLQGSTAYDLRLEGSFLARVYNTRLEPEEARVFEDVVLWVYNNGNLQVLVEGVQQVPPPPIDYVLVDQFGMVTGVGTFPEDSNVYRGGGKAWTMTANNTTVHSPYTAKVEVAGREWTGDMELGFDVMSTIWVDLELLPVIEFPEVIIEGDDVDLDASTSIGYPFGITQWTWETDEGEVRNGSQVTFIFSSDGEYEVHLRITDGAGNSNSTTIWLTVLDAEPEARIVTDVPDEVDEDQPLDLEGRYVTVVDDIIIQEWNFGDGTKANGASVTHIWDRAGEYNITFTVVETDGSSAEDTRVITVVNVAPVAVIKEVDLEVGKRERFDMDGSLSHDSPSDNGTLRHMWDMGGDPFLTGAQAFWRFEEVGVYEINLMVIDDDGAWDRATMTVTVFNRPPTIGPIPDVRLNDTDDVWSFKLDIADVDDDLANLTITTPEFEPGGAFNLWTERDVDGGWTLYVRPTEGRDGKSGEVTMTVRDPDGGAGSSTVEIFVEKADADDGSMLWLILIAVAILVVLTLGYYKLARKQVPPPPDGEVGT